MQGIAAPEYLQVTRAQVQGNHTLAPPFQYRLDRLKTLVLERGHDVKHIVDYKTTNSAPWQLNYLNKPSRETLKQQHKQARASSCYKKTAVVPNGAVAGSASVARPPA